MTEDDFFFDEPEKEEQKLERKPSETVIAPEFKALKLHRQQRIVRIGSATGVVIPVDLLRTLGFERGDWVSLAVWKDHLLVSLRKKNQTSTLYDGFKKLRPLV